MKNIPFFKPVIGQEEQQAVLDVLRSGWLTTGQKVSRFETEFAKYTGARHAIALSSCTSALHLALLSLDLNEGDEVITTPFTFCATASEILHAGGNIRFVDVRGDNANIDESQVASAVNEHTRAILPVHFAGAPCNMNEIMDIAGQYRLSVIEDAAHALEAYYHDQKIGSVGDFTCFSFYATKNITTGEGGMLTCDNDIVAEKLRVLSLHGMSKDAWKRYLPPDQAERMDYYKILYHGYKYNMSDIQAALGIVQLKRVEKLWQLRDELVRKYRRELGQIPEIELFEQNDSMRAAHHLMVIKLDTSLLSINRDEVMLKLKQCGIGTSIHFISLHLHPFFQEKFGYRPDDFPVASDLSSRVISLPLYPLMAHEDIDYIVECIKNIIHENRLNRLISVN